MKVVGFTALLALVAGAHAQALLSNVSMQGALTTSTTSGHDVYTRGGSPRSGYYYYWRAVTLQTTSSTVPLDLNMSTGVVTSTGTYYAPNQTALGVANVSFKNEPAAANWNFSTKEFTSPLPGLPLHEWATATVTATPRIYFSVAADTDVTITMDGTLTPSSNLYALSGEIYPSESGRPNTYTVTAGGTYCYWATATTAATAVNSNSGTLTINIGFTGVGGRPK
jgi:hypothetical protein